MVFLQILAMIDLSAKIQYHSVAMLTFVTIIKGLIKDFAKRDTRPLKGRDLTHKCSLREDKDHLVEKIWRV